VICLLTPIDKEAHTDMNKMSMQCLIAFSILVAVLATGCNNTKENKSMSGQPEQATAQPEKSASGSKPGVLTVRILPDKPTAATDLQASIVYSGSEQIVCQWERNGQVISGEKSAVLSAGRNHFSKGDRITVRMTAADTIATASVDIKNAPPAVTTVTFKPENVHRGVDLIADVAGADADGDPIQYQYAWSVNDEILSENSPVLPGTRFKTGDRVFLKVTPSDYEDAGEPFSTKTVTIPKAPPRFVSVPPSNFRGETYVYQAIAEDPDGDPLVYSLISGPTGMTINEKTGMVTLKIGKEHAGPQTIEIAVQNTAGLKTVQKYTFTLVVP
jgi:hypothetical protein